MLSPEVPLARVVPRVAEIFGSVCGRIGIVIALAALIGQCLMESGAADKITRVFVRMRGGSMLRGRCRRAATCCRCRSSSTRCSTFWCRWRARFG
ncbi:MAG: hypothetical protein FJW20_08470 [Acidimicrobiia bacterium]|nr:hypothetical protein [Acidimicrobiia bacterium]